MRLFFFLLLVFSPVVSGQIYKCDTEKGVQFSDTPCGEKAQVVDVSEASKPSGMNLSNPEMEALGDEMQSDRRRKDLDRAIEKQQKKIDNILDNYERDRTHLDEELADHKENIDYDLWRRHPYKKEQYYDKKRRLENKKKEVYRKFKVEREKAYNKLSSLKRERSALR